MSDKSEEKPVPDAYDDPSYVGITNQTMLDRDSLAKKVKEQDAEISEMAQICARWEAMCNLMDGEEVSDFMLSYGEIRELADMVQREKPAPQRFEEWNETMPFNNMLEIYGHRKEGWDAATDRYSELEKACRTWPRSHTDDIETQEYIKRIQSALEKLKGEEMRRMGR